MANKNINRLINRVEWSGLFGTIATVGAISLSALLVSCAPSNPVRLGFIGGLSGRVADLGVSGRNGAALAIELRNKVGGVNGRPVELIVEDDQQDPAVAQVAVSRLVEQKVEAIVGPMTSAMAVAVLPSVNAAKVVMVSPTVTTPLLTGIDDYFLRVIAPSTEYSQKAAAYHFGQQDSRRVAVIYDLRNKAYSESWKADYQQAFERLGGKVIVAVGFNSSEETQFAPLLNQLLKGKPDAILIIANSVDAALMAQQLRKRNTEVRINTSEWAATERLIELGGKAVDGMVIAQFVDRLSTNPTYVKFRQAYLESFAQEPGFAGLAGYDAANVLLDALTIKKAGQSLKQTILDRSVFTGAQSEIRFDPMGDSARETYMTTIHDGTFIRLK